MSCKQREFLQVLDGNSDLIATSSMFVMVYFHVYLNSSALEYGACVKPRICMPTRCLVQVHRWANRSSRDSPAFDKLWLFGRCQECCVQGKLSISLFHDKKRDNLKGQKVNRWEKWDSNPRHFWLVVGYLGCPKTNALTTRPSSLRMSEEISYKNKYPFPIILKCDEYMRLILDSDFVIITSWEYDQMLEISSASRVGQSNA